MDETSKAIVHTDFAHCIQHISLFGPGYEALKANPDVVDALDTTVDKAWTEQATVCARAALKQLVPERHTKAAEIDPDAKHIMMSCECTFVSLSCHCYQSGLPLVQEHFRW